MFVCPNGLVGDFLLSMPEVRGFDLPSYNLFIFSSLKSKMLISDFSKGGDTFVCILFCDFTKMNRVSKTALRP